MLNAAVQNNSFPLAGQMYANVNALDPAKPNSNKPKMGNILPLLADDMKWIATAGKRAAWTFETSTRVREGEFLDSRKKGLPTVRYLIYGYSVPAKSGTGIGVPELHTATHDAPSVFFCVVNSVHPFFSDTGIIRAAREIMVGCVGASSEAPVPVCTGYANPIQFTTSEIGVSGGDLVSLHTEAAKCWPLTLPKIRNSSGLSPQFAAIVRQSSLLFTILLLILNVMLAVLWCVSTSVSLLAASLCRGCVMIKTYDLPQDPTGHSANLISLALLMDEVLKGNADSRDEYLAVLISLFEVYARDLHSLLEGHALPEVSQ